MTHFDIVHTHFGTVHTLFTSYDTVHTHFDIVHIHFGRVHTEFSSYDTAHNNSRTLCHSSYIVIKFNLLNKVNVRTIAR